MITLSTGDRATTSCLAAIATALLWRQCGDSVLGARGYKQLLRLAYQLHQLRHLNRAGNRHRLADRGLDADCRER
eukprot:20820-Heterococcus_DN1.PRE.3